MEFFDKKEEVLEIKLTPFGRYRLSKGDFKPTHYSFFDDGITYNSEYMSGGVAENQSTIDNRIRHETPTLKTLNVYEGVQTTQAAYASAVRTIFQDSSSLPEDPLFMDPGAVYNRESLQKAPSKIDFLSRPMGTSRQNSDKDAAWAVSMRQGEIATSTATYTSTAGIELVPQLNITVKCDTYNGEIVGYADIVAELGGEISEVDPLDYLPNVDLSGPFNEVTAEVFPDGTYLAVRKNDLVIELAENNAPFQKRNFDIEVFLSSSESQDGIKQLYFNKNITAQTQDDVGYYLTFRADKYIDTDLVKKLNIQEFPALGAGSVQNAISTREYFVKDIYELEEDICE